MAGSWCGSCHCSSWDDGEAIQFQDNEPSLEASKVHDHHHMGSHRQIFLVGCPALGSPDRPPTLGSADLPVGGREQEVVEMIFTSSLEALTLHQFTCLTKHLHKNGAYNGTLILLCSTTVERSHSQTSRLSLDCATMRSRGFGSMLW